MRITFRLGVLLSLALSTLSGCNGGDDTVECVPACPGGFHCTANGCEADDPNAVVDLSTAPLWARRQSWHEINDTHRNGNYLGDVELPKAIRPPATPPRRTDRRVRYCSRCRRRPADPTSSSGAISWADATLVSVAKGIELDTLMRMSQVICR
jgi:glycerol-3-phosphate dehydrogenase